VPFSSLQLHPDLLTGIRELGFARPTPIQADAIPPGVAGRDVLACAQTGSGKTAAFLLPILHRLIDKPRRTTRALILTPTRELAAQILEDFNALAVHTPLTGAAVYGGVGMGPQEHAFRSGVDVIVATPGRLLDHFRQAYAKLAGIEYLVLDEADRMLDMGFLPDIRRVLKHIPTKRQTLFFSATMPPPIAALANEMLKNPVIVELLTRGLVQDVLVFTRTKHRANRLADHLLKHGMNAARIHGNRSQAQRTEALAGFKSGKYRVLVATDIAARGIDVEALSHVVNFDVPAVPEDYIHRVGRTGRAELTGDAFTFVSPEEEGDLRAIERAVKTTLPRITLPDFDYKSRPQQKLEVPLAQRIAEIRARKAEERARARANQQRREGGGGQGASGQNRAGQRPSPSGPSRSHGSSGRPSKPRRSRGPY
jgi:ATP-dependent RNA helicase RhlE